MNRFLPCFISRAAVFAAALMPCIASAQTADKVVSVISRDGTVHEVVMSEIDRIDIGASSLTVHKTAGDACEHDYASIDRLLIGCKSSVTSVIAPGEIAVWPTAVETELNVSGAAPGTLVAVYSVGGTRVCSSVALRGDAVLDLSGLPAGVYVVAVGDRAVKITKK